MFILSSLRCMARLTRAHSPTRVGRGIESFPPLFCSESGPSAWCNVLLGSEYGARIKGKGAFQTGNRE